MFGSYLLAQGLITERQLVEALDRQSQSRLSLGRLAFEREILDVEQIIAILDEQKGKGLRFGETAVALGWLEDLQLQELLELQEHTLRPLGQVLAEAGVLPIDVLERELERFEAEGGDASGG